MLENIILSYFVYINDTKSSFHGYIKRQTVDPNGSVKPCILEGTTECTNWFIKNDELCIRWLYHIIMH